MPTYSYETNEQPVVRVYNCSGDVAIIGRDQSTIELSSDVLPEQFHQSQRGIELNAVESDLQLHVPRGAIIQIENADGNVQVRDVAQLETTNIAGDLVLENIAGAVRSTNIEGRLKGERCGDVAVRGSIEGDAHVVDAASVALEQIEGNALIEGVPTVRLGRVEGNLRVNNAAEHCEIGQVEGNVLCRNARSLSIGHLEGDLTVDNVLVVMTGDVQGNARLSGAFDQVTMGAVQGDLTLQAQLTMGGTYRAHVLGNAAVQVPDDANLVLQGNVVGDIKGAGVRTDHPTNMRLIWGAGEASLQLSVIGDLVLHGPPPSNVAVGVGEEYEGGPGVYVNSSLDLDMGRLGRDFANLGREIAASFGPRAWAGKRGRKGNWRADVGLNPEQPEQIKQQVRASVNQAQNTVRQVLREARVVAPPPPAAPMPPRPTAPPAPSAEPATGATVPLQAQAAAQNTPPNRDAERLALLRMVREGTVTPEEAETLLAALDG